MRKDKVVVPLIAKPASVKSILRRLRRKLKWERRNAREKVVYLKNKKVVRKATRKVIKNSIRKEDRL